MLSRSLPTRDEGIVGGIEGGGEGIVRGNEGDELLGVDPEGKFVFLCLAYVHMCLYSLSGFRMF